MKKPKLRICSSCGKTFETYSKSDSKCLKCRGKKAITETKFRFMIKCSQCGVAFGTNNGLQKFCSSGCKNEFYKDIPRPIKYEISKEVIFKRDNYRCIYCGSSSIEDGVKLELEHIYPVSKGGKEDLFNLATSCGGCNGKKSAEILSEEIILRIWKRNEILNQKIDSKSYEELTEAFRRNLESRISRLSG